MRPLNENLLRELAEHQAPLCLTLLLEVAVGGGEHNHIRIAMKNAKAEATEALGRISADDDIVAAVRERLDALDYDDLAGGSDRRVAVFIAPELTEIVDANFAETGIHVGPQFRLAPLLADLVQTPDHAILVASEDATCLYRSSRGTLSKQDVEGMPASLEEISKYSDMQEKGNIHGRENSGIPGSYKGAQATAGGSSGPQGVPHHSMGGHDWREDQEQDLRQYANFVVNAVQRHLAGMNLPLIIAADERLYGMIRENSEYPFLVETGITHHPKEMDEDDLRDRAAACLADEVERRRAGAWDKIAMSLGRGDKEASLDPADITTSAAAGRIAHLFIRDGASLPGRFDQQSLAATASKDGSEDLVDRAIVETLRNGGDVFLLEEHDATDAMMAAAYRYPA